MVNINLINSAEIIARIEDFEKRGGCIQVMLFEINENYQGFIPTDEYLLHLTTARQTIETVNYQGNLHWNKVANRTNRNSFPILQTDHKLLAQSGIKMSNVDFFGYYYDLTLRKPLIRGKGPANLNTYFYYDQEETSGNKIDIQKIIDSFHMEKQAFNGGFSNAFLEPPYGVGFGKTIREVGEYFLDFVDFLFSDVNTISAFEWSTDCSSFFDAGKEWWGSYFWTVYNPTKNWYIGMVASETD